MGKVLYRQKPGTVGYIFAADSMRISGYFKTIMPYNQSIHAKRFHSNKRRAVAAQTARCCSKVLSIHYVYYFRAYQRQWNGRQIIRWKVRKLDLKPVAKTLVILC